MKKIRLKFFFLSNFFVFAWCQSSFTQNEKRIDSILNVLQTAKEDTNKAFTLFTLGRAYALSGRQDESKKNFDAALALAGKLNSKRTIARIYFRMGVFTARGLRNFSEALENFLKALKIWEEIGDKWEISDTYHNIGLSYHAMHRYYESIQNLIISIKVKEEIRHYGGIADIYNTIGSIYNTLGIYPEAMKNYLTSLRLAIKIGDKRWEAACNTNIGLIYATQGNYTEALKNHFTALKLYEEVQNKGLIAIAYKNIGNIYSAQGNYPEASKNHLTALKLYEELGNKINNMERQQNADLYNDIGEVHARLGNFTEAMKYYQLSLEIFEKLKNMGGISDCYIGMGRTYIELKRLPEAKQYLSEALSLSLETGSKKLIRDAFESLCKLDSAMGNYEQALDHYKLYTHFKDSLLNDASNLQTAQLKEQYESEKKDKDILQLTSDKQKQHDSLLIVQAEKEKVELENERTQALNLYNLQQIVLLGNDKKLQQLQIEKDKADYAVQQEQLQVMGKEKDIQSLQLKKQKESKNYFIAGLALLAILSFFVFRNFQNQRKLNKLYKISAEKQMAELQLQSLRAQLNPHFMFNSLNAIQELIVMEENEKSQAYLERFSQLLRQLLENANQPFVPLRKEIGFLDLYLSLEKLRLPDLKYSIEVDPNISGENFVVPNMMLQPYIENALWHGLQHKQGEKKLQLHISRQNGTLHYEIKDNGVGRKKAEELKTLYRKEHRSKGMELLSQRFDLLSQEYGQTIQTKVTDLAENGNAAGTLVEISVPVSLSVQKDFI